MKIYNKIVVKSVFLIGLVFFMLLSVTNCNKNEHPANSELVNKKEIKNQNLSVIDNRLVFETRIDYENTINYLSKKGDDYFPIWEKEIGFNSARKIAEEVEDNDEELDALFATLLNPDYIIQIGNNIFKIDMKNERIYVLDESDFSGNESFRNRTVVTYSTNDNVLDILDGVDDSDRGYCNTQKKGYYYWNTSGGQVMYKIVHQKAGIYHSLQAKIKKDHWGGAEHISYSTDDTYGKCFGRNKKDCYEYAKYDGGFGREYNYRAYNSSRRLKAYRWRFKFYMKDGSNATKTNTLEILCDEGNSC